MSAPDDDPLDGPLGFGGLTFDARATQDPDRRRRNNRRLISVIVAAGVLVVALAVAGGVVVSHYLDNASTLAAKMSVKYHDRYRSCVEGGGERGDCATRAEAACAQDPGWTATRDVHARAQDITDTCLFGPDVGN